jgi:ABC-type sugar transport system ATPase subunit
LVLGRGLDLFQRRRLANQGDAAVIFRDVLGQNVKVDALALGRGEVLGLTGLPGAGAKELARALFGLTPAKSGTIAFGDERPVPLPATPSDAFAMGIGYLSDDRRRDGVVGHLSIAENIALSSLADRMRFGFIDTVSESNVCCRYFGRMGIKAPNAEVSVNTLSGGNQQKVGLGRVLAANPRLLILDEPTRGIDVGVKQEVLRIIDSLSRDGVSVIIISTDTDELVRAVDRVCAFRNGSIVETIAGDNISSERLRELASA